MNNTDGGNDGAPKNTQLKDMNEDLNDIKKEMRKNVDGVIGNKEDLNELLIQAKEIHKDAIIFEDHGDELKERSVPWCKKYCPCIYCCCNCFSPGGRCDPNTGKICIGAGIVIVIILTYFIWAIIRCNSANLFC